MRRLFAAGLAGVLVAAFACGEQLGLETVEADAGPDAASGTSDAGDAPVDAASDDSAPPLVDAAPPPVDGGPVPNPSKISCGTVECPSSDEVCCVFNGIATCIGRDKSCNGRKIDCDETADCAAGWCILHASGSVLCRDTDPVLPGEAQLCKSDSECKALAGGTLTCAKNETCIPGQAIYTCGGACETL